MVERHLAARGISDLRVLEAMGRVPRERFVASAWHARAYADEPLPIARGQTVSQPYVVAAMLEALALTGSERVLEVGAGAGYSAAVLGLLAATVHTVERHEELATLARANLAELGYDNVHVHLGDGSLGLPELSPFDRIAVAAGSPSVPPPLVQQLAIGGRLVIPVEASGGIQDLVLIRKRGPETLERSVLFQVRFVPLIAAHGWAWPTEPK